MTPSQRRKRKLREGDRTGSRSQSLTGGPKPGAPDTHPIMQWAAVSTHRLAMRDPPHMCLSLTCRLTCQGHFLSEAGSPPAILIDLWPHPGWLTKEKGLEVKLLSRSLLTAPSQPPRCRARFPLQPFKVESDPSSSPSSFPSGHPGGPVQTCPEAVP